MPAKSYCLEVDATELQKALDNSRTQDHEAKTYENFCREIGQDPQSCERGIDRVLDEVKTASTEFLLIKVLNYLRFLPDFQHSKLWTDGMIDSWIEESVHRRGLQRRKPLEHPYPMGDVAVENYLWTLGNYLWRGKQPEEDIKSQEQQELSALDEHLVRDLEGETYLIPEPKHLKREIERYGLSWGTFMECNHDDWERRIRPKLFALLNDERNIRSLQCSSSSDGGCRAKSSISMTAARHGSLGGVDDLSKAFRQRFFVVLRSNLSKENYGKVFLC